MGFLFLFLYPTPPPPPPPAPPPPTIFHTQLCHTLSFTHATLSHTFVLRGRRGTWQHRPSFCVAGMALMALRWVWWRGGPLVARDVAALCVAGVALGDIRCLFARQVWHLVTSTFSLCGRRGTYGTGLALVALMALRWLWWRAWAPLVAGDGVALGDIHRRFAWQVWCLVTSTFSSRGRRGRRGTYGTGLALVALMALRWLWWRAWAPLVAGDGVALGDIHRRFAWQVWCLVTSTFSSRGRRGAYGTGLPLVAGDAAALCVAGVARGDIHLRFAWGSGGALGRRWSLTAWHFAWHFAWQAWRLATSTLVLPSRSGTSGTGWIWWRAWSPVALGDINFRFAWQVWHLVTSTFVLRGRRGAW